jgi:hypothetical protein
MKVYGFRGWRQSGEREPEVVAAGEPGSKRRSVRRGVVWLAVVVAAVYSWFAARTTPFTTKANVMVAIPILLAIPAAAYFGHVNRTQQKSEQSGSRLTRPRLWPWWSVLGLIGAWELFCYLQLPRYGHPTFSSLYDSASRSQPFKAVLFLGWLALGWAIVHTYRKRRP